MLILHGENTTQSRQRLFLLLEAAKNQQQGPQRRIVRLDAKTLDLPGLETALGSESLFGEEKLVVIEELHSLPKSQRKEELLTYIANRNGESDSLILWEKRDLTPIMLKKFPSSRNEQFKVSKAVFQWLDSLAPATAPRLITLFREAAEQDGEMMCLSMLARQIRLLLQAKEGNFAGMAPFMIGKLQRQANLFSESKLLAIHDALLQMDLTQKTSSSRLSLTQQLELFLLTL